MSGSGIYVEIVMTFDDISFRFTQLFLCKQIEAIITTMQNNYSVLE